MLLSSCKLAMITTFKIFFLPLACKYQAEILGSQAKTLNVNLACISSESIKTMIYTLLYFQNKEQGGKIQVHT
ncbi:hypothetical protein PRUPE_3G202100 [Prunus persica]|uniref:Uncharacterized protein n=1 Tax=Prunus persica TaxID=3760 RepID=A0A251Q318_PRUPE|nr:hypothetical protein PRUPE_3G202100 [Prunus persica]